MSALAAWNWFIGLWKKGPEPSKYTGKVWTGTRTFRVHEARDGFIPGDGPKATGFVDHSAGYWVRLYDDGSTSDDSRWEPYTSSN